MSSVPRAWSPRTGTLSPRPLRHPAGFTLIELMVVVAIMGILAALASEGWQKYTGVAARGHRPRWLPDQ